MGALLTTCRSHRFLHRSAAVLRIALAFAFLPAGLKKVLGQPFTDPSNTGAFHEFLHAFHATGGFYRFVGVIQLVIAALLVSQRHAWIGSLLAVPMMTAIAAFTWSTNVPFTASIATAILLAHLLLVAWAGSELRERTSKGVWPSPLTLAWPWQIAGALVCAGYVCICAIDGGVYRPVPTDRSPLFFAMNGLIALPVAAWILEGRLWSKRTH